MASTPVCTIDASGIHAPTFADVLTYVQGLFTSIYGADIYLGNDSQDGQFCGALASMVHDANSMAVAAYNAYSPATAQGTGLSTVVKINGLTRLIPTQSTVDVLLTGQAGTIISNGVVFDSNRNKWNLPSSVTIPIGGSITVTATAQAAGNIAAGIGTVTGIATPTLGWQSVTNAAIAVPGSPVESDAALRQRQAISTAQPSLTALEGLVGGVAAIAGVTRYQAYENDTKLTDSNGIPSNNIALIVEGGDATAIAAEIAAKKTPGAGTYGSVATTITDAYGIPHVIKFSRPTEVTINLALTIKAFTGYTSAIGTKIVNALVAYINALPIGADVYLSKLYPLADLTGADAATFAIVANSIQAARSPASPASSDVTIAYNEAATTAAGNVNLVVT